jgi:hypothetical protein
MLSLTDSVTRKPVKVPARAGSVKIVKPTEHRHVKTWLELTATGRHADVDDVDDVDALLRRVG